LLSAKALAITSFSSPLTITPTASMLTVRPRLKALKVRSIPTESGPVAISVLSRIKPVNAPFVAVLLTPIAEPPPELMQALLSTMPESKPQAKVLDLPVERAITRLIVPPAISIADPFTSCRLRISTSATSAAAGTRKAL